MSWMIWPALLAFGVLVGCVSGWYARGLDLACDDPAEADDPEWLRELDELDADAEEEEEEDLHQGRPSGDHRGPGFPKPSEN